MIAPKRRLTNYALHGREEWFKRIFRDQIAEAAGILEVVLSGIVLARKLGATAKDIATAIHPHPSMSEGIMEAAAEVSKEMLK